jgi:glycosyltransferase involved in cell wall biosynthesis
VIANGVDHTIFTPGDARAARARLGIPFEAVVLLFGASGLAGNSFKDYPTVREAAARAAELLPDRDVLLLALGSDGQSERSGRAVVRFVPLQDDPAELAQYYRAADLYLHAARAETFPLTVLEALACGTPVVATAVGGIPEQVRSLDLGNAEGVQTYSDREATGVLVASGDSEAMAHAARALVDDADLLRALRNNARADACRRFRLDRQADEYLGWYGELIEAFAAEAPRGDPGRTQEDFVDAQPNAR